MTRLLEGREMRNGLHTAWPSWNEYLVLIPEYRPPARVEAWLTLPPGVVVARDHPDWDGERYHYRGIVPRVQSDISRRFRARFGNQAALDWSLEPDPHWLTQKTMREVWTGESLEKQLYDENPWLGLVKRTEQFYDENPWLGLVKRNKRLT